MGRSQVRSPNRTHEVSKASSGGLWLEKILRMGKWTAQGDGEGGKYLRDGDDQFQQF